MDWLDKIIKDAGPGERAPHRAFSIPRLSPYLWDSHLGRSLCAACWQGTGRIIALTWTWCMAKPGDRIVRGCAPVAALAGAGGAVVQEPRAAVAGIALAWIVAAAVLAPREVWAEPEGEAPAAADEAPPALSPQDATERDRIALLVILEKTTRGRNGVHLGELHKHLAGHPLFGGVQRAYVGPLLEGLGVPYQRTLSVDGVEGRSGVRRADVEALLVALPQDGDSAHSQPSESGSDLQESRPLSDDSQAALGPVSGAV